MIFVKEHSFQQWRPLRRFSCREWSRRICSFWCSFPQTTLYVFLPLAPPTTRPKSLKSYIDGQVTILWFFFSQQILFFIKDGFLNYLTMPLTTLFHRRVNINVVGKLVEKRNLLWGSNIWQPFGENWRVSALPGDKEMKISERRNRRIVHIFVLHQIVNFSASQP